MKSSILEQCLHNLLDDNKLTPNERDFIIKSATMVAHGRLRVSPDVKEIATNLIQKTGAKV